MCVCWCVSLGKQKDTEEKREGGGRGKRREIEKKTDIREA